MSAASNVLQFPGTSRQPSRQETNMRARIAAIDSQLRDEKHWLDHAHKETYGKQPPAWIESAERDIAELEEERAGIVETAEALTRYEKELGQSPAAEELETPDVPANWAVPLGELLATPSEVKWLLEGILEESAIALLVGPRGSYKSFLALDWAMRVALTGKPVFVVSAEGNDFDRRAAAWLKTFAPGVDPHSLPIRVAQKRVNLNSKASMEHLREECADFAPKLFVFDTMAKLTSLDEDSNTEVKQFIGLLDNWLRRHFKAAVLMVAHTGHSDQGRARGASALGADTDAEFIVSRRGDVVTVSRQRFKSSPELPDLKFCSEIVDLGRLDANSQPVSSIVLKPAEGATPPGERLLQPSQRPALEAVRRLERELGSPPTYDQAFEAIADLGAGGKSTETQRVQNAKRTVRTLQDRGLLFRVDAERVSCNRVVKESDLEAAGRHGRNKIVETGESF
jgi:putative DNA primase/helicase